MVFKEKLGPCRCNTTTPKSLKSSLEKNYSLHYNLAASRVKFKTTPYYRSNFFSETIRSWCMKYCRVLQNSKKVQFIEVVLFASEAKINVFKRFSNGVKNFFLNVDLTFFMLPLIHTFLICSTISSLF